MTFSEIFSAFYRLYRAEATVPASTDDEFTIAMSFANEAIQRWSNYDNTYWKELFTTAVGNDEGVTIQTGTTDYDAPDDMKEVGGFVKILDSNNNVVRNYPIIEPQDVQFKGAGIMYAYFTGDQTNGFTMHLNPSPDSAISGMTADFVYYKQPTTFTSGSDVTEMSDPYFIVHRMLAQRFRASRNPYYTSALRDSEDSLKIMQMKNNSGNWADPWSVTDNSGSSWGL